MLLKIANPDMLQHYTGFATYNVFSAFYIFFGPAVECLIYSEKGAGKLHTKYTIGTLKTGRIRTLQPVDELLMVLMHLCLGLLEQDLTYRFAIYITVYWLPNSNLHAEYFGVLLFIRHHECAIEAWQIA